MGWDAFARRGSKSLWQRTQGDLQIADPALRRAFKRAESRAMQLGGGTCDGFLVLGSLDVSDCADAITAATGHTAYDETDWSPEFTAALLKRARWPTPHTWASASAKVFMETCVRHKLTIHFSW